MALTDIINTLLPTAATDNVAVFDQDFNQIFRNARAIKAVIKEEAKLMEHPVESGAIITDHRIILPVQIELSLILLSEDYQDVYKQIRQIYFSSTLVVVQTRAGVYENQIIQSMPHEEDPEQYDVLVMALSLKQVQFVRAEFGVIPKQPKNSTTTRRGTQQGTPANTQQTGSAANDFFKGIGVFR